MHIFIISIIAFLQDVWLSSIKIRYLKKDFEDALAKLKKLNGLKENDDLVKLTLDVLKTPRCGEKYSSTFPSTRHLVKKNGHYNLTIHVEKPSHLISEKIQKSIIEGSIKSWNEHIPIVFQWVTNDADIDIVFIDGILIFYLYTSQYLVILFQKFMWIVISFQERIFPPNSGAPITCHEIFNPSKIFVFFCNSNHAL